MRDAFKWVIIMLLLGLVSTIIDINVNWDRHFPVHTSKKIWINILLGAIVALLCIVLALLIKKKGPFLRDRFDN